MKAPAAPAWFTDAIESKPEHRDIDVDGARIHYRAWGEAGTLPGIVLLHGGAAHSGWWDHIAPQLSVGRRVIAVDLSGHGDSAWKAEYDRSQWAREVVAAVRAEALDPAIFIGHSMGGWVSVFAGVLEPDAVREVIAIDSPFTEVPPEEAPIAARRPATKIYPSLEDALPRFRTVPPQDGNLDYVTHHIAIESLRRVDGSTKVEAGWTWKFDPGIFGQRGWVRDLLPQLTAPLTLIRCERGMLEVGMVQRISELLGRAVREVPLPKAGHHAMFDQPLPLVASLRTLLEV
ncbi:MAG TPA: alpha/beta hydrolase [Mycobacteriales bacterium]|nr:alpha/beta hydrolase [Mycobacteriales bacterium]